MPIKKIKITDEIWKDVEGFEGIYQVSNLGRVRSLDRIVPAICHSNGRVVDYHRKGRILRQQKINSGYRVVTFIVRGKDLYETKLVHRLVAHAFVTGYKKGLDVNHKDEDKTNNKAENLEWCDKKYNNNYGTGKWRRRKFNARPVVQLSSCGEHIANYNSISEAARTIGCDPSTIRAVCVGQNGHRKCYTAKGYKWRYAEKVQRETA